MRASAYPLVDAGLAASRVLELVRVLPGEDVPLAAAAGRVLVDDLVASSPLPPFRSSAVDGYAIRAADAGSRLPLVEIGRAHV